MADDAHLPLEERPGPDKTSEIPADLYDKAHEHNDQLTEDERALLLSRGDDVGKALAHPDSLTLEERYHVLQWSPPDELHAAIHTATGGAFSTPEALYTCATRSGGFAQLAPEAQRIVAGMFWVDEENASPCSWHWLEMPGNGQATSLLYGRAGIDFSFLIWLSFLFRVPASHLEPPLASLPLPPDLQEALATVPRPPPVVLPSRQVDDHVREASRRSEAMRQEVELRGWREKRERERELAKERGEWPPLRRRYESVVPRSPSDEISQLIARVVAKPN